MRVAAIFAADEVLLLCPELQLMASIKTNGNTRNAFMLLCFLKNDVKQISGQDDAQRHHPEEYSNQFDGHYFFQ